MTAVAEPAGVTAVVANPASGSAGDDTELRDAIAALGVDIVWLPTTEDDPGVGQAADAVGRGVATVVAAGGDGTVRAVLESVAGSGVALGIVALGTGNLLASNLDLPTGLDAVPAAVSGPVATIDTGRVNGERFAVMSGVGFDAVMIRDANPTLKQHVGSAAYVLSALRNLRTKVVGARVEVDGTPRWHGRTAMVLVGNCGTVSGGLEVFPDAAQADGVLDVAILAARGPRQWLSVLWRLLRHRPQRPELVRRFRGSTIRVVLGRPMPYELDGEVRDPATELDYEIDPASLRVRVAPPEPQ